MRDYFANIMSINLVKTKSRVARGRKSKQSFSLPLLCYVSYTGTWYHRAQLYYGDPFHWHGSTWINNYKHFRVWDEIIYPFPNVYGVTVEAWKCTSHFKPHLEWNTSSARRATPMLLCTGFITVTSYRSRCGLKSSAFRWFARSFVQA